MRPLRARARALAALIVATGGCARVAAHQRQALAAPAMQAPVWPAVTAADEHVFSVREGTGGATGTGGGGCGCE